MIKYQVILDRKDTELQMLETMLITNNPAIAKHATDCGVSRIFIDLETLGKEERQKNQNLLLSNHTFNDISIVKEMAPQAKIIVRLNPPNPKTTDEVRKALDHGADVIMLPYFHHPDEVDEFLKAINNKCTSSLLVETSSALGRIERILNLKPAEIHIGLNDLRLTLNLANLFELIVSGLLENVSQICKQKKISFGIGGIGSISKGAEISPEAILKEYARLGSERVILSRAFTNKITDVHELKKYIDIKSELAILQDRYKQFLKRSSPQTEQDKLLFTELINNITRLKAL